MRLRLVHVYFNDVYLNYFIGIIYLFHYMMIDRLYR